MNNSSRVFSHAHQENWCQLLLINQTFFIFQAGASQSLAAVESVLFVLLQPPASSLLFCGFETMSSPVWRPSMASLSLFAEGWIERTCFLDKHSWVAIKFLSLRGRYLCIKKWNILNAKHPLLPASGKSPRADQFGIWKTHTSSPFSLFLTLSKMVWMHRTGHVKQKPMGNSTTRGRNGNCEDIPSLLHQRGCSRWKKRAQTWCACQDRSSRHEHKSPTATEILSLWWNWNTSDIIPASNEQSIYSRAFIHTLSAAAWSNCTAASLPWTGRMNPAFYWITLTSATAVLAVRDGHIRKFGWILGKHPLP